MTTQTTPSLQMPNEWVNWIRRCHADRTDFGQMKDILLKNFDQATTDAWIDHVWYGGQAPVHLDYDFESSWMPRDLQQVGQVTVEYLNLKPVVAVLHNVLSEQQCAELIKHYQQDSRISRATVHSQNPHDGTNSVVSDVRTNQLAYLTYLEHDLIVHLERTISEVTDIPVENGESCQLLYYQLDQQYTPHDDFFHDRSPSTRLSECGQRIATVITYLNTVESGGGTHFPALGITVPARAGTALYFEYTDSNGASTELCRHAGLPVQAGEKWAITKWLRLRKTMPDQIADTYKQDR